MAGYGPLANERKYRPVEPAGDQIDQLDRLRRSLPPSGVPAWAEVPATLASGALSSVVGGLAGLGTIPLRAMGIPGAPPAEVTQSIQQAGTYLPRSVEGMGGLYAVGKAAEALHAPVARAADLTLGATGSPALATAVDVGPTAVGALLGLPGAVGRDALRAARSVLPEIAPSAGGGASLAAQRGSLSGIKRHPMYWHGTSGGPDIAKHIAQTGKFTEGGSAELKIPGTSLSADPLLSYNSFAGRNPYAMLRVTTDIPPSEVRNLSPVEYLSGVLPSAELYRKPNLFFREDETFARRLPNPDPEAWAKFADEKAAHYARSDALRREMKDKGLLLEQARTLYPEVGQQLDELWANSVELAAKKRALQETPPRLTASLLDAQNRAYLLDNIAKQRTYENAALALSSSDRPRMRELNNWYNALNGLKANRATYNRTLAGTVGDTAGGVNVNPVLSFDSAGMSQVADFLHPRYQNYRSNLQELERAKRSFQNTQAAYPGDPQAAEYLMNQYRGLVNARGGYTQGLEDIFKGRVGHYR